MQYWCFACQFVCWRYGSACDAGSYSAA